MTLDNKTLNSEIHFDAEGSVRKYERIIVKMTLNLSEAQLPWSRL